MCCSRIKTRALSWRCARSSIETGLASLRRDLRLSMEGGRFSAFCPRTSWEESGETEVTPATTVLACKNRRREIKKGLRNARHYKRRTET
jgi:hypothetical protein